jgi:hypothetical protein
MATEAIALLIDDREGGSAGRMGTFASKGAPYEIDLSEKNIDSSEELRKPYRATMRTAHPTSISRRRGTSRANSSTRRVVLQTFRDWARSNASEVSDRGRIAASIVEACEVAK